MEGNVATPAEEGHNSEAGKGDKIIPGSFNTQQKSLETTKAPVHDTSKQQESSSDEQEVELQQNRDIGSKPQVITQRQAPHITKEKEDNLKFQETINEDLNVEKNDTSPENQESQKSNRKRRIEPVMNPNEFKIIKQQRKIPKRIIENVWEPLDSESLGSLLQIFNMCVNQSIEKYAIDSRTKKKEPTKKMLDAQTILREAWISDSNSDSFFSRLKHTNLPSINQFNMEELSLDKLIRRKKMVEAHYSADMKQLNELKKNHHNLQMIYNQDEEYLKELRKKTEKSIAKLVNQTQNIRTKYNIDTSKQRYDNEIKLRHDQPRFDPNNDPDTRIILKSIHEHFERIKANIAPILKINEELEKLHLMMEKRKFSLKSNNSSNDK